jgi:succinate dehydrogenase / fumarate reductase, cytochrome b subunit
MSSAETPTKRARPLSPHLQVYRLPTTAVLSILHRITGVFLCAGAVVICLGLLALADGMTSWDRFVELATSLPGKLIMAAFLLTNLYHFLTGMRHLVWDAGSGFANEQTARSNVVLIVLFAVGALALLYLFFVGGAP